MFSIRATFCVTLSLRLYVFCLLFVLVNLSVLAKWLTRKTPLRTPKEIRRLSPRSAGRRALILIIKFKLAVVFYRAVHGTAPRYLSDLLQRVSDITSRRRLRSSTSSELVIPLSWLVTVGDRSFAVAVPRLWNTLPEDITSAPSLLVFRRKLKTHLFWQYYPDIILLLVWVVAPGGPWSSYVGHLKNS